MPRIRKTGAVYPIRHEQRKTLKDGTVKTYVNWQAKVDGRWVSAKTYKECDRKIAEALKEKTEWGMGVDRATRLGEYAERWFELKRRDLKPKSINNYASLISVHLCKYANEKLGEVTASAVQRMIANMRNLDGTHARTTGSLASTTSLTRYSSGGGRPADTHQSGHQRGKAETQGHGIGRGPAHHQRARGRVGGQAQRHAGPQGVHRGADAGHARSVLR
jgi:hypothetical protein